MSSVSSTTSTAATTSTGSTTSTTSTNAGSLVTFSGLASGVDTASIVSSIIQADSQPITDMQNQETLLKSQLSTYQQFNTLLNSFEASVTALNSPDELKSFQVANNGSNYFSVSTNSLANPGNYSVKVVSLAQQQKDVSNLSMDTSTTGIPDTNTTNLTGTLTIGGQALNYSGVTLNGLTDLINNGNYGISASMVDEGNGDGYRLMMTANTASDTGIDIIGTGSISLDTTKNGHTVSGTRADVNVDGVDYYSTSNTVTNALKGTTITLLGENTSTSNVSITSGAEGVISTQLQNIVDNYNAINTAIQTISTSDPSTANAMQNIQYSLKNFLTSQNLVNLGISSDWQTGIVSFDSTKLSAAYTADPSAVSNSLFGDNSNGIMNEMDNYLNGQLDSTNGFLATKTSSINDQTSRLDTNIANFQTRMTAKQAQLTAQFTAMETLVSSLKSQGNYLTSFFNSYNNTSTSK